MSSNKVWVDFGDGLGMFRDPSLARTPEAMANDAKALGEKLAELLGNIAEDRDPVGSYWYKLRAAEKRIAIARKQMENDLLHLGVITPEKFDWNPLRESLKHQKVYVARKRVKKDSSK